MTELLGIDAQAISRRAHELWLQRGCPTGTPECDWQEAERQLQAEALQAPSERATPVAVVHDETQPTITTSRAIAPVQDRARAVPRPRAPRSIVTRSGYAPAARLLAALVPEASPDSAAVSGERSSRR